MNETYYYLNEINDLRKDELVAAKQKFYIDNDVQTPVPDLPIDNFVDGNTYTLFPCLENTHASDILPYISSDNLAEAGTLPPDENPKEDCNGFFEFGLHPGIYDSIIEETPLPDQEVNLADLTDSPLEFDSAVSSPEMNKEVADLLLAGFTEDISSSDISDILYHSLNTINNLTELGTTDERHLLKEILEETDTDFINVTTDQEVTITQVNKCSLENTDIGEKNARESGCLSNLPVNDCLNDRTSSVQDNSLSNNVVSSVVDFTRMSALTNQGSSSEDPVVLFINTSSSIDSVNIPLSSKSNEITHGTSSFRTINEKKRKHSSQGSDISSLDNDDISSESSTSSPIEEIFKQDTLDRTALRRHKNNEASKVTRAKRKCAEKNLMEKEKFLIKSNAELRSKVENMQKESDKLHELLTAALSSVNGSI